MDFEIRYTCPRPYYLNAVCNETFTATCLADALAQLRFNVPDAKPVAYRVTDRLDDCWKKNSILF
jgi:hypothetical protein